MSFQAGVGVAVGIIVGLGVSVAVQAGVGVSDGLGVEVGVDDAFSHNCSILLGVLSEQALIRNTPANTIQIVQQIFLWLLLIRVLLFLLEESPQGRAQPPWVESKDRMERRPVLAAVFFVG